MCKMDKPLASGVPPWHAGLFIGVLLGVAVISLPSVQDLDDMATVNAFSDRLFPSIVSLRALAWIRGAIAISIWSVALRMICWEEGWNLSPNYLGPSKCVNTLITLKGFRTLFPFTSWAWISLGVSFSLNSYIASRVDSGNAEAISHTTLRLALVVWEMAAPLALMVSAVVRYAIYPITVASGRPHDLASFRNQMMHNVNSVYALSEMALLGGIPMTWYHLSIPVFLGSIYILFTWTMAFSHLTTTSTSRKGKKGNEDGPQYIYFFMDTTLGKTTTLSLLALLTVLLVSFCLFTGLRSFVSWMEGGLLVNAFCVLGVSGLVIRTK